MQRISAMLGSILQARITAGVQQQLQNLDILIAIAGMMEMDGLLSFVVQLLHINARMSQQHLDNLDIICIARLIQRRLSKPILYVYIHILRHQKQLHQVMRAILGCKMQAVPHPVIIDEQVGAVKAKRNHEIFDRIHIQVLLRPHERRKFLLRCNRRHIQVEHTEDVLVPQDGVKAVDLLLGRHHLLDQKLDLCDNLLLLKLKQHIVFQIGIARILHVPLHLLVSKHILRSHNADNSAFGAFVKTQSLSFASSSFFFFFCLLLLSLVAVLLIRLLHEINEPLDALRQILWFVEYHRASQRIQHLCSNRKRFFSVFGLGLFDDSRCFFNRTCEDLYSFFVRIDVFKNIGDRVLIRFVQCM
mmetsp:Transcript_71485/g.113721  ORF Transcript_71485/g.113721 Transcript_71485/m.113721 type:complete len:359 (-) Transcript_71485:484-1560(-)